MRTLTGIRLLQLPGQESARASERPPQRRAGKHAAPRGMDGPLVSRIASNHRAVPDARVHSGGPAEASARVAHPADEQQQSLWPVLSL